MQDEFDEDFAGLVHVFVRGVMDWCISTFIVHLHDVDCGSRCIEMSSQLLEIHPLNILVDQPLIFRLIFYL